MDELKLIYLINFLRRVFIFSTQFYLPFYFLELGFNGLEVGVLFAFFAIPSLLTTLPTGLLNDRFTVKKLIFFGLLMLMVHYIGLALTNSFFLMAIILFIGGLGNNISETSISSFVLKKVKGEKGKEFSIYTSANFLGVASGFLIGGILLQFLPFTTVFWILAALYFLLLFLTIPLSETIFHREELGKYKSDLMNRNVLVFALILFLFSLHWGAERVSYSPFLREVLNLNFFESAIYMTIPLIALAAVVLILGRKIDKVKSVRKYFFAAILLSGLGHIAMTIPDLGISFIFRVVHEIGDGVLDLVVLIGIAKLFKDARIGGNSSFIFLMATVGLFIGSLIFGPIAEIYGHSAPLVISGIISLVALVIAFFGMDWIKK
ncbi:MAG: MFS transporter [Candidatus Diapherotrites archaeon]